MTAADLRSVTALLRFLEPSFPAVPSLALPYGNMAALLADVSLQAGLNYSHVVRPRVAEILEAYPDCRRVRDLSRLLEQVPVCRLLRWKDPIKLSRFISLFDVLLEQRIDGVEDLAAWSDTTEGRAKLMGIRGIGKKTVDYLRLLCGRSTFPIDRHFARFLWLAGVNVERCGYDYAQQLLLESCHALGFEPRATEKRLWSLLRACS